MERSSKGFLGDFSSHQYCNGEQYSPWFLHTSRRSKYILGSGIRANEARGLGIWPGPILKIVDRLKRVQCFSDDLTSTVDAVDALPRWWLSRLVFVERKTARRLFTSHQYFGTLTWLTCAYEPRQPHLSASNRGNIAVALSRIHLARWVEHQRPCFFKHAPKGRDR